MFPFSLSRLVIQILPATCVYVRFLLLPLDIKIIDTTANQLVYLIIVVATGKAALPMIALIMLAVTYGLQVSFFFTLFVSCWPTAHLLFVGSHLHHQARVHACWMDDCLSSFVRLLSCLLDDNDSDMHGFG